MVLPEMPRRLSFSFLLVGLNEALGFFIWGVSGSEEYHVSVLKCHWG